MGVRADYQFFGSFVDCPFYSNYIQLDIITPSIINKIRYAIALCLIPYQLYLVEFICIFVLNYV